MNSKSLETAARLRSSEAHSFYVDPLAFTEEIDYSNQDRSLSTEEAKQPVSQTTEQLQSSPLLETVYMFITDQGDHSKLQRLSRRSADVRLFNRI